MGFSLVARLAFLGVRELCLVWIRPHLNPLRLREGISLALPLEREGESTGGEGDSVQGDFLAGRE